MILSDEVCGNLRHIQSNTTVVANDTGIISANKTFPSSKSSFLCLNTTEQQVKNTTERRGDVVTGYCNNKTLKFGPKY